MNLSSVVSAAAGVIVTTMINAITDPVGRAYDRRAKRVQHWKSVIEGAPSIGIPDGAELDQIKAMYRTELLEAQDEAQKLKNPLAANAASLITVAILIALLFILTKMVVMVLPPPIDQAHRDFRNQFSYALFWTDLSMAFLLWYFARPKIRDIVWNRYLKPGRSFNFCIKTDLAMKRAEFALAILLVFGIWFVVQLYSLVRPIPPP